MHRDKIAAMDKIGSSKAVRAYLREWREHKGLTQEQLAGRMETTSPTISKKENEPDKVDIAWLRRFADGLNVSFADLFRDPARPTPQDLLRQAASAVPAERASEAAEFLEIIARRA